MIHLDPYWPHATYTVSVIGKVSLQRRFLRRDGYDKRERDWGTAADEEGDHSG
jgi:hypothetical protein